MNASGAVPLQRSDHSAVLALDAMMVVYGGLHQNNLPLGDVHRLKWVDPFVSREWKEMNLSGTPPPARCGHAAIHDKSTLAPNNPVERMIVFGGASAPGQTPTDLRVWELRFKPSSPDSATWLEMTQIDLQPGVPKPAPRYWHRMIPEGVQRPHFGVGKSGNVAFMYGGALGNDAYSDSLWALWIFNDGTVGWELRATQGGGPGRRARHSLAIDESRLSIFGGENAAGPADRYTHMIDPWSSPTPIWSVGAEGAYALSGHTGVREGRLTFSRIPDVYDPATGSWQALEWAPLHWELTYPVNFVVPGGTSAGGRVVDVGQEPEAHWLDLPAPGQVGATGWQRLPNGDCGFFPRNGVSYRPGKIMIAGGFSYADGVTGTTKTLDVSNLDNPWQTSGSMIARDYHNLVLLPDGNVMVVGGVASNDNGSTNRVGRPQIWDPGANGGLGA